MKGLLLINTGSPASYKPRDVRAFIEAMLSDPLVMTVPDWFRPLLVKGIIGPFRQFYASGKYKKIWNNKIDRPLLIYHAEQLAKKIEEKGKIRVEVGMTYLEPSISDALAKLSADVDDLSELVVLPLFPHFAESSYLPAVNIVKDCCEELKLASKLKIIEPYFNHPKYIKALSQSLVPYLQQDYDRIIFNFHSLPLSHVEKGFREGKEFDYVYQAKETVRLLVHESKLNPSKIRIAYSSAFGKKWLEPSLNSMVKEMGASGVKKIMVVSPGFASDNLETLYDIDIEARKVFSEHGGGEFTYIPCLNSEEYWVEAIQEIIS